MVALLVVDAYDDDDDADAVVDACDADGGEVVDMMDMMDLHLAAVDVVWQASFEMVISMLPSD